MLSGIKCTKCPPAPVSSCTHAHTFSTNKSINQSIELTSIMPCKHSSARLKQKSSLLIVTTHQMTMQVPGAHMRAFSLFRNLFAFLNLQAMQAQQRQAQAKQSSELIVLDDSSDDDAAPAPKR